MSAFSKAMTATAWMTVAASAVSPAQGQMRVATPSPSKVPTIQKPSISGESQAISALRLRIDALRESVGRQVVVLHFPPVGTTTWAESGNSFPENTQRAEKICKDALGDRYGRVLSRKVEPNMETGRWYFPNVVCETAP
jgi:hypothetical protein